MQTRGIEVVGVEPAQASLDFAQRKPSAEKVRWILGDATTRPPLTVDMAVMSGNVAQVFVTDKSWNETLSRIRATLRKDGLLPLNLMERPFRRTPPSGFGSVMQSYLHFRRTDF